METDTFPYFGFSRGPEQGDEYDHKMCMKITNLAKNLQIPNMRKTLNNWTNISRENLINEDLKLSQRRGGFP